MPREASRPVLMQGNEACAAGALAAGVRFFAGYPITPSSEIAEILAERLPRLGGKFIQMEDEIASMAAVIGASLTGTKAMTATSGPGFSLKQENIGYAAMAEIPCLIVQVQRTGPSTGLPTSPAQADVMQARWGTHGDHPVVVMTPSSVREAFDLTVECLNWSEALRVPAILLMDETVGHMRENVVIPEASSLRVVNRSKPQEPPGDPSFLPYRPGPDLVPPMASFGDGYMYHVTGLHHDDRGYPIHEGPEAGELGRRLMDKLERRAREIIRVEWITPKERGATPAEAGLEAAAAAGASGAAHPPAPGPSRTVVVSYGGAARSAEAACQLAWKQGLNVVLLRLITLWPFPDEACHAAGLIAGQGGDVVVVEMNLGQVVREVSRAVKGAAPVRHFGHVNGELLTPEEILQAIRPEGRRG